MRSMLTRIDDASLQEYLQLVVSVTPIDQHLTKELATKAVAYYKGNTDARATLRSMQELEQRWYESLKTGAPDYSVYEHDYFLTEAWACWAVYSRKYVKAVARLGLDVQSVADLGCGIGYTTAALKEVFPHAVVCGTQIEGSTQFKVAEQLGQRHGFAVYGAVQGPVDLVFASEYFEHFQRPIEHLENVLNVAAPKFLVIANAFGSTSIGHFNVYLWRDKPIVNYQIGRLFNDALRRSGYEMLPTGFWNNRPTVWRRTRV
jgi:SAM-dependent methyltransferase